MTGNRCSKWRWRGNRLIYDQISGLLGYMMLTVDVAQAKAHLSELLDRVEAGEDVIITRHGRAFAHLHAFSRPKRPLILDDLAAFRATMLPLRRPSVELLRKMRDEGA